MTTQSWDQNKMLRYCWFMMMVVFEFGGEHQQTERMMMLTVECKPIMDSVRITLKRTFQDSSMKSHAWVMSCNKGHFPSYVTSAQFYSWMTKENNNSVRLFISRLIKYCITMAIVLYKDRIIILLLRSPPCYIFDWSWKNIITHFQMSMSVRGRFFDQ
jgi:hypothetical protein